MHRKYFPQPLMHDIKIYISFFLISYFHILIFNRIILFQMNYWKMFSLEIIERGRNESSRELDGQKYVVCDGR